MDEDDHQQQQQPSSYSTSDFSYYLLIPHLWRRQMNDTGNVYYVTPSGRVLLCHDDVAVYLQEPNSCKCHLDLNMDYDVVFDFDPQRAVLHLPPKPSALKQEEEEQEGEAEDSDREDCETFWRRNAEASDQSLSIFVRNYLSGKQAETPDPDAQLDDPDSAYSAVIYSQNPDGTSPVCIGTLDLLDFLITENGHYYVRCLSANQVKHLAFQIIVDFYSSFRPPLPFEVFILDFEDSSIHLANESLVIVEDAIQPPPPPSPPPAITQSSPRKAVQREQRKPKSPLADSELEKKRAAGRARYHQKRASMTPEQKARQREYYRQYMAKRKARQVQEEQEEEEARKRARVGSNWNIKQEPTNQTFSSELDSAISSIDKAKADETPK